MIIKRIMLASGLVAMLAVTGCTSQATMNQRARELSNSAYRAYNGAYDNVYDYGFNEYNGYYGNSLDHYTGANTAYNRGYTTNPAYNRNTYGYGNNVSATRPAHNSSTTHATNNNTTRNAVTNNSNTDTFNSSVRAGVNAGANAYSSRFNGLNGYSYDDSWVANTASGLAS